MGRSSEPEGSEEAQPEGPLVGAALGLLVSAIALMLAGAGAIVLAVKWLPADSKAPEVLLPTVLIVGLVVLVGVLGCLVAAFHRFGLQDETSPLGLPSGSIQAVLALGLVLIFAIVGVYLVAIAGNPPTRMVPGLTRAQLSTLTPDSLVSTRGVGAGRFDATVVANNKDQLDIAKQLLTTISTLVVAVAAFYFGQKSVVEAGRTIKTVTGHTDDGDGTSGRGASGGPPRPRDPNAVKKPSAPDDKSGKPPVDTTR